MQSLAIEAPMLTLNAIAARAVEDVAARPRLAHALVATVTEGVLAEPAVTRAVVAARRTAVRRAAHKKVATSAGVVVVRATHPSAVVVDVPCNLEAGRSFLAASASDGVASAADAVATGNLPPATVRGALALCASVWPRKTLRLASSELAPVAQAALPFLQSVRAEGHHDGPAGPALSLRLLSEPDDRPLVFGVVRLDGAARRCKDDADKTKAGAAPLLEILADPIFQRGLRDATQRLLGSLDVPGGWEQTFRFRDVHPTVRLEGHSLIVTFETRSDRFTARPVPEVLAQASDPRVALQARLNLARLLLWGGCRVLPSLRRAARSAGLGELEKIGASASSISGGSLELSFALPAWRGEP